MGGDFNYQDAVTWFTNLDRLIKYTNLKAAKDGLNIKLMYSTPNCYLKSVNEAKPTLPIKQDDFFPYASDPNSYWTGYFTSRPTTKYFERRTNVYLQMLKQLQALTGLPEHNMFVLNELKSAMGIMQHHDAITGTEKQHVTHDYERILTLALDDALIIARQGLNKLMYSGEGGSNETLHFDRCHLNESRCDTTERSKRFIVTLYNTESWVVKSSPVRIPVSSPTYAVIAPNGEEIVSQIVEIPEHIRKLNAKKSKATHEVVFLAYNVYGYGYKSFYVQEKGSDNKRNRRETSGKMSIYRQNEDNFDINSLNNYWKRIKDDTYDNFNYSPNKIHFTDDDPLIVNLEEIPDEEAIPDRPPQLNHEKDRMISGLESNLDVLRDAVNEDANRPVKVEDVRVRGRIGERRTGDGKMNYPKLEDDELRMLADEPQTVEMYNDDEFLESENIKVRINNTTGQITNVILPDGTERSLTITPLYYPGCYGNNEIPQNRSSGAYIFRPNATKPVLIELKKESLVKGPVVQEARFSSEFVSLVVRVYDKADYIEVDWTVGPIPIEDGIGKEVIIKYNTDIVNNGEFYTDSNGRQVLKRKLNERPQWNLTVNEPIAGNYYPVTNEIHIKDDSLKLTVYTDRSEGGSSLEEGSIETMVHRRLLHDDAFGVGEALNETVDGVGLIARGTQRIYLSADDRLTNLDNEPIVLVSEAENLSLDEWLPLKNCKSLLKRYPSGIRVLTFEPWADNALLVRLENVFNKNSNGNAIEVNFRKIFGLKLRTIKETTLSGNMWAEDKTKMDWNVEGDFVVDFNESYGTSKEVKTSKPNADRLEDTEFVVHVRPKEIRTFVVEYDL